MVSSHEQEIWMIHDVHDTNTNMWVSYNGILPFRVREITLNPVSLYPEDHGGGWCPGVYRGPGPGWAGTTASEEWGDQVDSR